MWKPSIFDFLESLLNNIVLLDPIQIDLIFMKFGSHSMVYGFDQFLFDYRIGLMVILNPLDLLLETVGTVG